MKKRLTLISLIAIVAVISISFKDETPPGTYASYYQEQLMQLQNRLTALQQQIETTKGIQSEAGQAPVRAALRQARNELKGVDFWLRYLQPTTYKQINGPLPVEWETEVFEKFEKPYKREGTGLTLAALYLDEPNIEKDTLLRLIRSSLTALQVYHADSVTRELQTYHHFFLCNRLYLLNLAAIYTTGFECPDTAQIIPELRTMLKSVGRLYQVYNTSFPATPLPEAYCSLYRNTIAFAETQPGNYSAFDHFTFIRDYINPLFALNQQLIRRYQVVTHSMVDYSLTKTSTSIFGKDVYNGQNPKGIFLRVKDSSALAELDRLGKLLFYDPVLSGNNMRSCASCHKPDQYFTDTIARASLQYNRQDLLARNTPSLLNAEYNHLVMLDGKHFNLQQQSKAVMTNATEMGGEEQDILKKVLSCKEYKKGFTRLLAYTPQESEITFDHIAAALTYYYCKFSRYDAPFDAAINERTYLQPEAKEGFNLFMSKAQCATCHFVPQFNGVKPPFVSSEFEVLGVPADTAFSRLSADKGRYEVNPAPETQHAFRTGSVRNAARTMPYMHNGVFATLRQVIDFYDAGGGAGRRLEVPNQTLSSDSLKLSVTDKNNLIAFIHSLNEQVQIEAPPARLPVSKIKALNKRKTGGVY